MTGKETQAALTRFYDALARRDGEAMASMYSINATFEDPVFRLSGQDIGKMWIELLRRARDFSVSYTIAQAGSGWGTVEWTARYRYGGRRPVTNVVLSEIVFEGDRILRQVDRFDFPRWAAQALGTWSKPLARFSWFRRAISKRAAERVGVPARR